MAQILLRTTKHNTIRKRQQAIKILMKLHISCNSYQKEILYDIIRVIDNGNGFITAFLVAERGRTLSEDKEATKRDIYNLASLIAFEYSKGEDFNDVLYEAYIALMRLGNRIEKEKV